MSATLVDTNVLLDIVTNDPVWFDWSAAQLDRLSTNGSLVINDIIYAEAAVRFDTIELVDEFVGKVGADLVPIPRSGLFLAARAFRVYRSSAGIRTSILSDFLIGAHAAAAGLALLTRDTSRYRTYFPSVAIIAP